MFNLNFFYMLFKYIKYINDINDYSKFKDLSHRGDFRSDYIYDIFSKYKIYDVKTINIVIIYCHMYLNYF